MKKTISLWALFVAIFAVQAQDKADSLINILNTKNPTVTEQLELYHQICSIYSENDVEKCILYARKGLALAEKEGDKAKASLFYGELGVDYYTKSSYDTALMHQEKALVLSREIKDKSQETSVHMDIGNLYRRQSMYEKALENYMRARAISDSVGNKNNAAIALINISGIHSTMNNYERAWFFLKQAEEISHEVDNKYLRMSVCYRLGKLCANEGKNREAVEYALKAYGISRDLGDKKYEIATLNTLVTAYSNMKDYGKAMEYADQCVQVAEKYNDRRLLMGTLNEIAGVFQQQKQYATSAGLSFRSWTIDSTDLLYAPEAAKSFSVANIHLGNSDKAAYYLDKYSGLIAQRTDKNSQDALMEMEAKYETEKKEIRITALEEKEKLYIWFGVAGGIVVLLAFVLLYYRHRLTAQKSKAAEQKVKQLEQEKQLIATQSVLDGETAERTRLARDLHDGLGGMLSVVKLNLKDVKGYAVMDGADAERFGTALDVLDQSIGELRRVAHHIMPDSLMRYGLRVSLEDFCRAIPGAAFQYYGNDARLDGRLEVLIYRCAHELVNNAVKHATATVINVQLMADDKLVSLTVGDNGAGFDSATVTSGTGLENIRTRVSAYNGRMNIISSPGKGTEVSVEIERNEE